MRDVVTALGPVIEAARCPMGGRGRPRGRLEALDAEVRTNLEVVPPERRKLVTGHESMGYFASRYGFVLIGAIIPGISSQGEVSARQLAGISELIREQAVPAIFAEVGTPQAVIARHRGRDRGPGGAAAQPHPPGGWLVPHLHPGHRDRPSPARSARPRPWDPSSTRSSTTGSCCGRCSPASWSSIACSVVGTFVVLRGLAFIGDALAHGVLPGIAAALLIGLPGIVGRAAGALAMIGGVTLITSRSRLSSDTAIGLLFVSMLALGVVIVSRSSTFTGDLVTILFGQVLGTSVQSLVIQGVATAIVVAVALVCARPFLLLSFDPEQADVAGFPSRRYHRSCCCWSR